MIFPEKEEIQLMDNLLKLYLENPSFTDDYRAKQLGVSRTKYNNILRKISDYDSDSKLLIYNVASSGTIYIVRYADKIEYQKFIEKGGFEKVYQIKKQQYEFELRKEEVELDNLETSLRLNKYLLKTKWLCNPPEN